MPVNRFAVFESKLDPSGVAEQVRQAQLVNDLSPEAREIAVADVIAPAPGLIAGQKQHLSLAIEMGGENGHGLPAHLERGMFQKGDGAGTKLGDRIMPVQTRQPLP